MTNQKSITQLKAIRNKRELSIKFREYSSDFLGYVIHIAGEKHYVINSLIECSEVMNIYCELLLCEEDYPDYGFIMLQKDHSLYVNNYYKFNHKLNKYIIQPSNDDKKVLALLDFQIKRKFEEMLKENDE